MKRVILTGGAGGIASEVHDLLQSDDLDIVLTTRPGSSPPAIYSRENEDWFQVDLRDRLAVWEFARAFIERFAEPPWAIINMAGKATAARATKEDLGTRELALSNLTMTMNMCAEFAPLLCQRTDGGRIINVSSVVASTGAYGASGYAAAKGAIEAYGRSLALEVAKHKVTVNTVALGYIDAGMIGAVPDDVLVDVKARTPVQRLGEPHEVAALLRYLLDDDSGFMTGQTIHLDGGLCFGK